MTRLANLGYHEKYSDAARAVPKITVYFLQASRAIRTVWLLEELGLPYALEFANRENQKAPQAFKDASGNPLGKFPSIKDGDLTVYESGAITEYLCDHYDDADRLIPQNAYLRARTQTFVHAAEGTLLLHALAVLYFRWQTPAALKEANPDAIAETEAKMGVNVQKDFDWLDGELAASTGNFLVGDSVTAADIMMHFSAEFALERELGTAGKRWPRVDAWMKRCADTPSYKRAVEKSGYTLHPKTT